MDGGSFFYIFWLCKERWRKNKKATMKNFNVYSRDDDDTCVKLTYNYVIVLFRNQCQYFETRQMKPNLEFKFNI